MDSARTFFSGLPPPAECLAILVGCAELTIFGLGGLANPAEWAKGYGVPLQPASASQKHPGALESTSDEERSQATAHQRTQTALVAAVAARNVQNGLLMLAFACYTRDRRALGMATLANVVATVADALIARAYGVPGSAFGHVVGVVNSIAIGGALLHWGRSDPWW